MSVFSRMIGVVVGRLFASRSMEARRHMSGYERVVDRGILGDDAVSRHQVRLDRSRDLPF